MHWIILIILLIIFLVICFYLKKTTQIYPNHILKKNGYQHYSNIHGDMISHMGGARSMWVKGNKTRLGSTIYIEEKEN